MNSSARYPRFINGGCNEGIFRPQRAVLTTLLILCFLVSGCAAVGRKEPDRTIMVVGAMKNGELRSDAAFPAGPPADGLAGPEEDKIAAAGVPGVRGEQEEKPVLKHIGAAPPAIGSKRKMAAKRDRGEKIHVELAFDNADLYEVLDVALFELYGVSYMLDPSLKAKVTFHLAGEYTQTGFIDLLSNVLQLNGLAITAGPGNIYKIVRKNASASASSGRLLAGGEAEGPGDATRLIRLKYMAAGVAAKNIRPFLTKGAVVVQDTLSGGVVITDTKANLDKAAGILGSMDVPWFREVSWQLFPLREVTVGDVAADIAKLMKAGGPFRPPASVKGGIEIIPVKTMNALLVVTRWPAMLSMIGDWIAAMDRADDIGTNVYVYFVENGSAAELVDILKQLYGAKASDARRVAVVKPEKKGQKVAGPKKTVTGELSGDVSIIADETNNAIVFKAADRDYRIMRTVLKQLDIVPRQVLINVVIAEVSHSNEEEFGVQWLLDGSVNGSDVWAGLGASVGGTLGTPITKVVTGGNSGFVGTIFNNDGDLIQGVVSALAEDRDVTILSSPNILALDNKEANFEVVDEVPTETGSTVTDGGTTTTTIEFKKTGVILKVVPHINSNGLVKMDLEQEVSSLGEFNSELNNFDFLIRKLNTSLVVADGQTIVMGGLMRNQGTSTNTGIPVLKEIPYLGSLFGSKSDEFEKVELIFFITPSVIHTRRDADAITREFSNKIKSVKDLIDTRSF